MNLIRISLNSNKYEITFKIKYYQSYKLKFNAPSYTETVNI